MLIDIFNMAPKAIAGFKGGEGEALVRMHQDEMGKVAQITLPVGASIGYHTHDTSSEIMYFLSGKGTVTVNGTPETVTAGACHYCKKGSSHGLVNDGDEDLVFFAVVPAQ